MAILRPKPWVNPLEKMSIFRLFELHLFIAQKGVFLFQNIIKDIFLAYNAKKRNGKKWLFLNQNHGLTTLVKCQFFDFSNFLCLQPRKTFSRSRISQKTYSWTIMPKKKKVQKMAIFGPKPWVNPFRKISIFRLFQLLVFID